MKRIACAAVTLMVLFSGQSYAEQVNHPAQQNNRDAMILPTAQQTSPFDFNHMGVGSDKSDALGVPYYHQRS
ncbi:multiple antibiotic resistance protein MarB [Kosakonia sp. R1.Fl]|uniref:multiple antibiotic resistance protein MarB n=1 Tax=Kosakonia sp. R1.Fl TaxID=2928706 RepID=UPI00201D40C0|nr:multiple antibiotic resistance protein MarB [Kosakonia sp. R1.Fl]MCL6745834.1 multiple antibiotic resistance protein MarB [Kosakonia sp. R1.Fl]